MTPNVPMSEIGTATLGISVARALRRNRNTTRMTSTIEIISVRLRPIRSEMAGVMIPQTTQATPTKVMTVAMVPGAKLEVGDVLLELTDYAAPCSNLRPYFLGGMFIRVSQKKHPGWSRLYARVLREGDVVSLDLGVVYKGWHGDAAITVPVGRISAAAQRLLDVTARALALAIAQVRPGGHLYDVGGAVEDFAARHVFAPLGSACVEWAFTPLGLAVSGGGLRLSSRDLHKTGQTYLDGGAWRGNRVVSEVWVSECTRPQVRFDENTQYGSLWCLRPFPRGLARKLISTAPSDFIQHARNPERSVHIGGTDLVFAPVYGSPFVHDLDQGRRYGTIEDFRNFVKLAYMTPWLHHSGGTVCELVDLPVDANLPPDYIASDRLRLEAYRRLAAAADEDGVRGVIEELIGHALTQGIITKPVKADELFVPSTRTPPAQSLIRHFRPRRRRRPATRSPRRNTASALKDRPSTTRHGRERSS